MLDPIVACPPSRRGVRGSPVRPWLKSHPVPRHACSGCDDNRRGGAQHILVGVDRRGPGTRRNACAQSLRDHVRLRRRRHQQTCNLNRINMLVGRREFNPSRQSPDIIFESEKVVPMGRGLEGVGCPWCPFFLSSGESRPWYRRIARNSASPLDHDQASSKQHFLNFRPLPHGQESSRPILDPPLLAFSIRLARSRAAMPDKRSSSSSAISARVSVCHSASSSRPSSP